ncbi:MAG: hypothetical protein AAF830_12705 [Pseudomonadota bacterium]
MPRRRKEKPSPKAREERIRIRFLDDPFMGDRDALVAELERRLDNHFNKLGPVELRCRIIARGLEPPEGMDELCERWLAQQE